MTMAMVINPRSPAFTLILECVEVLMCLFRHCSLATDELSARFKECWGKTTTAGVSQTMNRHPSSKQYCGVL